VVLLVVILRDYDKFIGVAFGTSKSSNVRVCVETGLREAYVVVFYCSLTWDVSECFSICKVSVLWQVGDMYLLMYLLTFTLVATMTLGSDAMSTASLLYRSRLVGISSQSLSFMSLCL